MSGTPVGKGKSPGIGMPVAYSGGTGGKVTSSRLPEKSKQSDGYNLISNAL